MAEKAGMFNFTLNLVKVKKGSPEKIGKVNVSGEIGFAFWRRNPLRTERLQAVWLPPATVS